MAAAATSASAHQVSISVPSRSRRSDGALRLRCRLPSRLVASAAAATTATTAAPLKADLPPAAPVALMRVVLESLKAASRSLVAVPDRGVEDEVGGLDWPDAMEYLTAVLTHKVYDVAVRKRLEDAEKLSKCLGDNFLVKREDKQPVFSSKIRGAYNMMAKLPQDMLEKGVICSSAGNHAQGVAFSAKELGCDAVVVMPVTTPEFKWRSVEALGATVVLKGDSYEAQSYAKLRCEQEGRTFIPPFDDPDIIAGQGTVGMEIVRQFKGPPHAIFVPVGGGGLISGIAAYVKRVRPEVKIIGVEPSDANAMALSLCHDQMVMLEYVGGFADGVALKAVGEETFRLCRELLDGIVMVSRDAICSSIKNDVSHTRTRCMAQEDAGMDEKEDAGIVDEKEDADIMEEKEDADITDKKEDRGITDKNMDTVITNKNPSKSAKIRQFWLHFGLMVFCFLKSPEIMGVLPLICTKLSLPSMVVVAITFTIKALGVLYNASKESKEMKKYWMEESKEMKYWMEELKEMKNYWMEELKEMMKYCMEKLEEMMKSWMELLNAL